MGERYCSDGGVGVDGGARSTRRTMAGVALVALALGLVPTVQPAGGGAPVVHQTAAGRPWAPAEQRAPRRLQDGAAPSFPVGAYLGEAASWESELETEEPPPGGAGSWEEGGGDAGDDTGAPPESEAESTHPAAASSDSSDSISTTDALVVVGALVAIGWVVVRASAQGKEPEEEDRRAGTEWRHTPANDSGDEQEHDSLLGGDVAAPRRHYRSSDASHDKRYLHGGVV